MTSIVTTNATESVPNYLRAIYDAVKHETDEQLVQGIRESLRVTADHLLDIAARLRVLEDRGRDLSDLKFGMLQYVRRIAHGQVDPNLVVQLQGNPLLLRRASALPLPEQKIIAENKPVTVLSLCDNGVNKRTIPPSELSAEQVQQVFAGDHLRSEAEQRTYLEQQAKRRPPVRRKTAPKMVVDVGRNGVAVMSDGIEIYFAPAHEIAEALSELNRNRRK